MYAGGTIFSVPSNPLSVSYVSLLGFKHMGVSKPEIVFCPRDNNLKVFGRLSKQALKPEHYYSDITSEREREHSAKKTQ